MLELVHEALPNARSIALLVNPNSPENAQETIEGAQVAARRLGFDLPVLYAGSESEIDQAFAVAIRQQAAAVALNNACLSTQRGHIASLSVRHGLPVISRSRADIVAGMLMSYAEAVADPYEQAGRYVGRILKGEKAGDLPVMQPTKFKLIVNLA